MERLEAHDYDYMRPSNMGRSSDPSVKFAFTIRGEDGLMREYQVTCRRYERFEDNLQAIQMTLERIWRMNMEWEITTEIGATGILGWLQSFRVPISQSKYLALPDPEENKPPHVILEIAADATVDEIKKAYRDLSKKFHPDKNNGDDSVFIKVGQAKDDMLEMRS